MILELEDQVCAFEWAARLKELGVRQDTCRYWHYDMFGPILSNRSHHDSEVGCAAYLTDELLALFPKDIELQRKDNRWILKFGTDMFSGKVDLNIEPEESLANVLARVLIALIKNKGDDFKKLSKIQ
jgi:hypothetical protein